MLPDFKRAFLHADCERELYIELPDGDERKGKDVVGAFARHFTGHRMRRSCGRDWSGGS